MVKLHKRHVMLEAHKLLIGTPHVIIWLPPYHPMWNAIELVWGISKPKYNKSINRALVDAAQVEEDFDLDGGLQGFEDGDLLDIAPTPVNSKKRPTSASRPRVSTKEVVKKCMVQALSEVTPEVWAACCEHTDRLIMGHFEEVKGAASLPPHPAVEFEVGFTSDEDDMWETLPDEECGSVRAVAAPTSAVLDPRPISAPVSLKENLVLPSRRVKRRETRKALFASFSSPEDDPATVLRRRRYLELPDALSAKRTRSAEDTCGEGNRQVHDISEDTVSGQSSMELSPSHIDDFEVLPWSQPDGVDEVPKPDRVEEVPQLDGVVEVDLTGADDMEWLPRYNNKLVLGYRDRLSLLPRTWLTDTVIDAYMALVFGEEDKTKVFSVHLGTKLLTECRANNLGSLPRLKRARDGIYSYERIVFPFHVGGNHWTLCIADAASQIISYYDSLGGENHEALECVKRYIGYLESKVHSAPRTWTTAHPQDVPKQNNQYDCGLFVGWYARCLKTYAAIPTAGPNMALYRRQVLRELDSWELEPMPQ